MNTKHSSLLLITIFCASVLAGEAEKPKDAPPAKKDEAKAGEATPKEAAKPAEEKKGDAEKKDEAAKPDEERPAVEELPVKDPVVLPLEITEDRLIVAAKIGGQDAPRCVVDTGVVATLINEVNVKPEQYKVLEVNPKERTFIEGIPAKRIVLPTLALGTRELKDVRALLVKQGEGTELAAAQMRIGMDLLSKTRFSVDFDKKQLLLWPEKTRLPDVPSGAKRSEAPVDKKEGDVDPRPWVLVKMKGGEKIRFLIDTAASLLTATIFKAPMDYGIILDKSVEHIEIRMGHRITKYGGSFRRMYIGDLKCKNLTGKILDGGITEYETIRRELRESHTFLGLSLLKTLGTVHIDIPQGKLHFEKSAPAPAPKK